MVVGMSQICVLSFNVLPVIYTGEAFSCEFNFPRSPDWQNFTVNATVFFLGGGCCN